MNIHKHIVSIATCTTEDNPPPTHTLPKPRPSMCPGHDPSPTVGTVTRLPSLYENQPGVREDDRQVSD